MIQRIETPLTARAPGHTFPSKPTLPPELAAELIEILADALVADIMAERVKEDAA